MSVFLINQLSLSIFQSDRKIDTQEVDRLKLKNQFKLKITEMKNRMKKTIKIMRNMDDMETISALCTVGQSFSVPSTHTYNNIIF